MADYGIHPLRENVRTMTEIEDLAAVIRAYGQRQPIVFGGAESPASRGEPDNLSGIKRENLAWQQVSVYF